MVQQGTAADSPRRALNPKSFMHRALFEFAGTAAKEAKFGIGPEAAVFDPASQELVLARNPKAGEFLINLCSRVAARLDARIFDRPSLRAVLSFKIGWDPLESTCRHASLSIL